MLKEGREFIHQRRVEIMEEIAVEYRNGRAS